MSSPEESKATHRNRQKSSTSSPSKDDSVSGLSSTTLEPKTKPTLAVVEQELQEIERMSHESFSESVISIEQVIRRYLLFFDNTFYFAKKAQDGQ